MTVYFSGADLANVCNEAALLAAGGSLERLAMDRQASMLPNRLNHDRIDAWCHVDNPERGLLGE